MTLGGQLQRRLSASACERYMSQAMQVQSYEESLSLVVRFFKCSHVQAQVPLCIELKVYQGIFAHSMQNNINKK